MNIPCWWTEQAVGQVVSVDVQWMSHVKMTLIGQVDWAGRLERTVGQAWSVRVGCPMHVYCLD